MNLKIVPYAKEYNYFVNHIKRDYYYNGTSFYYENIINNKYIISYHFFNSHDIFEDSFIRIHTINKIILLEYNKSNMSSPSDKIKFKEEVLKKFNHYFARKLWEYGVLDGTENEIF